ncbi:hypothetical protein QE382_001700 [Sphingobacterium zeae]|uniref:Uncharacterized protein n=1 Tax=Sphingobacterium zeae TaxID=1776859 RepID=A0ABU0U439_9SPHI|nr:hypothetical protein [Sphingobacterium zeae]
MLNAANQVFEGKECGRSFDLDAADAYCRTLALLSILTVLLFL